MTSRLRKRESHDQARRQPRGLPAVEPLAEAPAKSSLALKLELMDRSVKSRLIGGTVVVCNGADRTETLRDTIKRLEPDGGGLIITTYRDRTVNLRLREADTELKEVQGAIHIDSWPIEIIIIAPKGVHIPPSGRS